MYEVMLGIFGIEVNLWWFGLGCFLIYTPLCYVRKMQKFSASHIFADIIILITGVVSLGYTLKVLAENKSLGNGICKTTP